MSRGRLIRADDLVEVVSGKLLGNRGVVLRRTRARSKTYVRVAFNSSDGDGVPLHIVTVAKIIFEQLAAERGVDPFELDWIIERGLPRNKRSYPIFLCPLCERVMALQFDPEICPRCNWRKPSLLERLANAAKS